MAYTDITSSIFKATGEILDTISGTVPRRIIETKNTPLSSSSVFSDRQLSLLTRSSPNFFQRSEIISVPGRTENNLYARDYPITASNPANPFLKQERVSELPVRTTNKTVFTIKFSSPGGKEVQSRGYLDREAEEVSVHNNLNFRNYSVRTESLRQERLHTNVNITEDSFCYYRLGTGTFRSENEGILAVSTSNYNPILTGSRLHFWFRVNNDQDGAIVTDQSNNCVSSMHVINNNGTTFDIGIHSSSYGFQNELYSMSLILEVGKWYNAFMGQLSANNFYYFVSVTGSHYFCPAASSNQQGLSGLPQFGQAYSSSMPAGVSIDIRAPIYLSPATTNTLFLLEIDQYYKLGPMHDPRQPYGNWNPQNIQLMWIDPIVNGTVQNLGQKTGYPLTVVSQSVDSTPFFGYETGTATLHKVHKNTRYQIKNMPQSLNSDQDYIVVPKFDNGFFQYQIPYNMDQIQWVYRTFLKNSIISQDKFVNNDAMTASEYYFTESVANSGSLLSALSNDYSPSYGYPSWIQIRSGESWKNRFLKNKNLIIRYQKDINIDNREVITQPSFFTSSESVDVDLLESTKYAFKEPVVDFSNTKIEYIFDNNLVVTEPIYDNKFLNQELNNFTAKNQQDKQFINESTLQNVIKRKTRKLFPTSKTSGNKRTRQRMKFIFDAWRDDVYIRGTDLTNAHPLTTNSGRTNILNSRMITQDIPGYTIPSMSAFNLTSSIWPLDHYLHPTNQATGAMYVAGELMNQQVSYLQTVPAAQRNFPTLINYTYINASDFSYGQTLPWTAYSGANSVPFLDTEQQFSLLTNIKYKDYAIVSEFNMSELINSSTLPILKQILDQNSFSFVQTGSDYSNLFTDTHTIKDKLSFDINSVIQLRPYKNFYPCQITLQAAKLFSQSLSTIDSIHNFVPVTGLEGPWTDLWKAMTPFFSPGILFSSIKGGIPMPCLISGSTPISQTFAQFEDIFDPAKLMKNYSIYGTYFSQSFNAEEYKNLIKNFLSEVRYTFCNNSSLNYFESSKESEFKIFQSGTQYIMDIIVDTGKLDVSGSASHQRNRSIIGGVNYLGRKHNFQDTMVPIWWPGDGNVDSSTGVKIARLIFSPDQTRKYTLDEIFALINVYFFRFTFYYQDISQSECDMYPKVTSSFNIFEKETDINGDAKWKINSKWEFPFLILTGNLDRFSSSNIRGGRATEGHTGGIDGDTGYYLQYVGGLWHDFCEIPTSEQGLFIQLKDYKYTFVVNADKYQTGSISSFSSASLADQVGFQLNNKKRIGEVREEKKVSELLCIVPIVKSTNSFIQIDSSFDIFTENQNYIKKYVVPPKLGYDNGTGRLFFAVEVTDTWSKRDLAYIWQNLLPQNGLRHAEQNAIYTVNDSKVMNLLKDKDVYFMIFKCKLRSVSNEYPNIGYNWPWDYCSLLELCKIDIITEEKL